MNSTYNVGIPQQRRIQQELVRAAFLTRDRFDWKALYSRSDFFERHANFLQISIRAGNNPEEFTKWLRLCESRLRLLVGALDCPEMSVWPFAQLMKRDYKYTPTPTPTPTPKEAATAEIATATGAIPDANSEGVDASASSSSFPEALFFIGLRFAPNVESINLKQHTSEFLINQINSWEGRKPGMDLMINHVLQKDLPHDLIGKYVVTKPSAYEIPNPTPLFMPAQQRPRNRNMPVPKDIRTPGGGDANCDTRSTYSSIAARSVHSSMESVDETEASFDDDIGLEIKSRPHSPSPLGNFITVEGGPPPPQASNDDDNNNNKGGNDMQDHQSSRNTASNINETQQAQLYEFLTGKNNELLPCVGDPAADESCCAQSIAESQSDQSSTRSPIQKRPRNRSPGTEDSEQLLNMCE